MTDTQETRASIPKDEPVNLRMIAIASATLLVVILFVSAALYKLASQAVPNEIQGAFFGKFADQETGRGSMDILFTESVSAFRPYGEWTMGFAHEHDVRRGTISSLRSKGAGEFDLTFLSASRDCSLLVHANLTPKSFVGNYRGSDSCLRYHGTFEVFPLHD